jgi:hypothetical protein
MKTPRTAKAKSVAVKVDPKLKKAWADLVARVHAHEKRGAEDWDAEWEAVGAIIEHHPPLYEFGGYKNSIEFFKKELGVDDRVGRAYVRVAEHATPAQEIEFTVWRLDAAIGYLEAKHTALSPHAPIDFARVKIDGKALADCSVAFIKSATTRARKGAGKAETTAYRDALSKVFAKHAAFRSLSIRESHGRTSFHSVPNASLRTFAELVLEAKLPGGKSAKRR